MYLGVVKNKVTVNKLEFNNTYKNYNGGLKDYMNIAKMLILQLNDVNWLDKFLIYTKCFFKSFLFFFHKKTLQKGYIEKRTEIKTTPDDVEIDRNISTYISDKPKHITYYLFRIIPLFYYRTGLTNKEIEDLTK